MGAAEKIRNVEAQWLSEAMWKAKQWVERQPDSTLITDFVYYVQTGYEEKERCAAYTSCNYYLGVGDKQCGMGCWEYPECVDFPPETFPTLWSTLRDMPACAQAAKENQAT